jgi:predicted TPR repeat methyltransferase
MKSTSLLVSSGNPVLDRRLDWARGLIERGEAAAAAELLQETLSRAPGFVAGWFLLGEAEVEAGNREGAIVAFRKVIALDSDDQLGASLRLARLGKQKDIGAMSPAYVRTLFDQYAGRFDRELVGALAYRGPTFLLEAIDAVAGRQTHFPRVLDLGCGTGLMGETIRARAGELTGVDLSSKMIAAAEKKEIYDRLVIGDLNEFLDAERATYDLTLAADVFVYLSNLAPVLLSAAKKLSPPGFIAFTVETHGGEGVILSDTLRFAHGETHIRIAAETAELDVIRLEKVSTRLEKNSPVASLLVILRARGG